MEIKNFGHSTQLIGHDGHYVLTDPHFLKRCLVWPRKSTLSNPAELPSLDAVCISHAHPDHLNIDSFKYIPSTVPVVVPEGMGGALRVAIQNPIIELHWWTKIKLPSGISITAVPAKHPGGKWLPVRFRKVCGFLINFSSKVVYFAGDTRMGTHFREIGNTVSIDVALLPISNFIPQLPWGKKLLLSPHQAAEAAHELNAKTVIPIHWGSFGWSKSPNARDLTTFKGAMAFQHMENNCVIVPPGETWRQII